MKIFCTRRYYIVALWCSVFALTACGGNDLSSSSSSTSSSTSSTSSSSSTSSTSSSGYSSGAEISYPDNYSGPEENGTDLWLRFPRLPDSERLNEYRDHLTHVVVLNSSATANIVKEELTQGIGGLTGVTIASQSSVQGDGAIVVGTSQSSAITSLPWNTDLTTLGDEGYAIAAHTMNGHAVIVVAGNTEIATLYGSYALLRHLQRHQPLAEVAQSSVPAIHRRVLNHWDNLDRSVERGYAGRSLWNWDALPGSLSPKYRDYAQANASIGINGTVLTNVNADAEVLTRSYLNKVKALADVFRPYGIRVYLTARFSAPLEIGGLNTADPLNSGVRNWWVNKVDEIYQLIPDFGGFLVKANSEGQPGPQDYNRTHADGANMLAAALAPHDGVVMWRAFVYASSGSSDRIRQAYDEFKPLDGRFSDNVFVQPKNGPLDFQPREPFHPLFGAMPQTPLALELQITKEYLGQNTHLAYLGTYYQEVLQADTYAKGEGSLVARVIDGSLNNHKDSAIAGVANIGDDANWTGSHFNQANWYVFGRMAWDPDLSATSVADEWVRQSLSNDPVVVDNTVKMMMMSREALVNYMTPLGLVHIMGNDHHYGPGAWSNSLSRPEWNPVYYHNANRSGIGYDRTASGSNAVSQYFEPLRSQFANRNSTPEALLLFFHKVGWGEQLSTGRTVWQELIHRYSLGVDEVQEIRDLWRRVNGRIDARRYNEIAEFLQIQHYEARWWRDASLAYFASAGGQNWPEGYAQPQQSLDYYKGLSCPANRDKPRCPQIETGQPSPAILNRDCGTEEGYPVCCYIAADDDRDGFGKQNGEVCLVTENTSGYVPPNPDDIALAINVGGGDVMYNGIYYRGDSGASGGNQNATNDAITGANGSTLFKTERYGDFSYSLPLANGAYEVSLHLVELYWSANNERIINISVEGSAALSRFDIHAEVGQNTAYTKVVEVQVSDGAIDIDISGTVDNGTLSGFMVRRK